MPLPPHVPPGPAPEGVTAAFAEAINARIPVPALVALSPAVQLMPPPPPSMPTNLSVGPSSFSEVLPAALQTILAGNGVLVLDIRPHNAYIVGRLRGAISLSVPSTLLKRPNFSLAKLAQMLPTPASRERFTEWDRAARIVVYDADSVALADGSNLLGLLRKFRNEGYSRDVAFVKGGFHAVWRDLPAAIDTNPPPREDDDDGLPAMAKSASAPTAAPLLRATQLPVSVSSPSQPALSLSQRRAAMHMHSLSLSQPQSAVGILPEYPLVFLLTLSF